MRRVSLALIAVVSIAATKPAAPWLPRQAACPVKQAPAGLAAEIVKPMLPEAPENAESSESATDKLAQLTLDCAKQAKVPKARTDAYLELATWELTATGLAPELKARGIDPAMLGAVMKVGPGRANPNYDDITDAQIAQMINGLKARGLDVEKLDQGAWHVAGAYLVAASRAYRAGMPAL